MRPTATLSIRRFHERRDSESATPETLIRDADRLLAACGVERAGSWILRTVRDYTSHVGDAFPFGAYLLNRVELNAEQRRVALANSELACLLNYADPTGETAVRNVMKGANRGRN